MLKLRATQMHMESFQVRCCSLRSVVFSISIKVKDLFVSATYVKDCSLNLKVLINLETMQQNLLRMFHGLNKSCIC